MSKLCYKKSIMAMLFVLIYIAAATAFAQILPLSVLQDLTNSNIKGRILYDAIQAAAVIPFAVTYCRDTAFKKNKNILSVDTLGGYWRLCHIGNNHSAREVIRFLVLLNYCWMRRRICFSRLFASRGAKNI